MTEDFLSIGNRPFFLAALSRSGLSLTRHPLSYLGLGVRPTALSGIYVHDKGLALGQSVLLYNMHIMNIMRGILL